MAVIPPTAELIPMPATGPSLRANHGFLILIGSQFVSRAGDALLSLATVWLVLDLTHNNPLASTTTLAFEFLPFLLFGLLAGAFVDRWDRRRTMSVVDACRGLILLSVPVLAAAGVLQLWHIFAFNFVLSSLGRLFTPARQAMMPDLVEPDQLVRANAIAEGSGQAAWIVGPALGGVLIAVIGAANVFYLDAASFFISAAALLFVRPRSWSRASGTRTSLWQEMTAGIRYVRGKAMLTALLVLGMAGMLTFAPVPALLPVLVRGDLRAGARAFGILMACFFAGSVAGSTAVARMGQRLHRGRALLTGVLSLGIATVTLAMTPAIAPIGLILAVLGAGTAAFNITEYSLLQAETPPELRGRVFALSSFSSQALRPLALIVAGVIAGLADVRVSLAVMAVAALTAGVIAVVPRTLRTSR